MTNIIKEGWIKLHLKYICPHCPYKKKHTRDIKHTGKCWWQEEWKKGHYKNVPLWMGLKNFIRLYLLKKPLEFVLMARFMKGTNGKEKNNNSFWNYLNCFFKYCIYYQF